MSEIKLSAEESNADTVTIGGVTELRTMDVGSDGRLYVGKDYADETVTVALRIEENSETDVSSSEDTEN